MGEIYLNRKGMNTFSIVTQDAIPMIGAIHNDGKRQPKIKRHEIQSPIKQLLAKAKEASAKDLAGDDCMLLSFKHIDRNQGDSLEDWDLNEMLSDAIEALYGYSHGPIRSQAVNEKFTIYGGSPVLKILFLHFEIARIS